MLMIYCDLEELELESNRAVVDARDECLIWCLKQ